MLLTYSLGLGDCAFGEKKKWVDFYIYSSGIGWIFELLGVSLVEKFMNINELDEKFILNFWLGGVVKQKKTATLSQRSGLYFLLND